MLEVGSKAPSFTLMGDDGKEYSLDDYKGKKVLLYFYPKDSTPGCTSQACNLRDNYEVLGDKGYEVLGVSVQDGKSHKRFIEKNALPFHLIADTEHTLNEAFGTWGEKSMCGRKYMGTFRTTFIIDENGIIERVMGPKEIKVKEHSQQILQNQ